MFLINRGITYRRTETTYFGFIKEVSNFIKDFYDDREETEKDIWYSKNIKGAKIPASGASHGTYNNINFNTIPIHYREMIKKYFRTIITKKNWSTCQNTLKYITYFLRYLYSNGSI